MSDTQETDYLENGLGEAARMSHPILWEHSRKLERERDAAIEHWEEVQEYGTDEINAAVDLRQKLAQALVELDNMQDQRDLAMKVISRLERERDEALSVADELSAIAARYLGWHLSRTPMGPDDDHLAQARRISETIARWKALASA